MREKKGGTKRRQKVQKICRNAEAKKVREETAGNSTHNNARTRAQVSHKSSPARESQQCINEANFQLNLCRLCGLQLPSAVFPNPIAVKSKQSQRERRKERGNGAGRERKDQVDPCAYGHEWHLRCYHISVPDNPLDCLPRK